jgi:hypothetical protein
LDDQLADRVTITTEENNTKFRLNMLHCRIEDTGTYTAKATNQDCSSTCSAYLLVQQSKLLFMIFFCTSKQYKITCLAMSAYKIKSIKVQDIGTCIYALTF